MTAEKRTIFKSPKKRYVPDGVAVNDASVVDSVSGVTYTYTYDDLHRLTGETNNGGYGAMNVTYNAIGNITQKSVGSNTFHMGYDSSHKHAVDYVNYNSTNYDYTYDANGNMTQGYDFTNPASIKVRTIAYNVDNMPTSIYHGSGKTAALLYDGSGARAKKTVTGGTTTTTYYIGAHFEVKNGTAVKYIFAGNLRVAQIVGSTRSYFHKDHLGSSTLMTNASGALLESTNYEPFGGQRAHTGTVTSAYKFTDQEFDAENGLYNYDARMYDPVIGRFISPDNIIPDQYNPQSLNRYSYCLNNPLIYTDPTGHYWEGIPYRSPWVMDTIFVRGRSGGFGWGGFGGGGTGGTVPSTGTGGMDMGFYYQWQFQQAEAEAREKIGKNREAMGVPGCLPLGGNYARFGYRPLDALSGFIPGAIIEGSWDDIHNLEPIHEGIVFVDGSTVGYFNSTGTFTGVGVVEEDSQHSVSEYTFRGPLYDGALLWKAIGIVTKTWQGSGYNIRSNNCQDFNDAVREEYFNLGGKIISTDCQSD